MNEAVDDVLALRAPDPRGLRRDDHVVVRASTSASLVLHRSCCRGAGSAREPPAPIDDDQPRRLARAAIRRA